MIELRGSTWDHARGYDPLPASAEAYQADHPGVRIAWERRTLRDFAEMSIPDLAERYDLIVLDHPWLGATEARGSLLALDELLPAAFLADQAHSSAGQSHASYQLHGHQWALAIDAACQVSAYRPDLLEQIGAALPRTWDAVLALARLTRERSQGWVGIPLMHVDTFPCFFTLCANAGEVPFSAPDEAVSRAVGRTALDLLRELAEVCHPGSLGWNPPQMLDHMSRTDEIVYSPLLFGYTNYARQGYRPARIRFADIPRAEDGTPRGAILGGAGLAISSRTAHPAAAADYAAFVASGEVQRGLYFDHQGQPGHRSAWLDPRLNDATCGFFRDTLATLDHAVVRPRYNGWIAVQDGACRVLHDFLRQRGSVDHTLDRLDDLYRGSLT